MNILLDGVPYTVMIGDVEYPINYGFRTSMLYELLLQDDSLSAREKIMQAIEMYYPIIPHDLDGAMEAVIWFYTCGHPPEKEKQEEKQEEPDDIFEDEAVETVENRIYSFEHDAAYIFASFMEQYGIDLAEIEDEELHWWKFMAMFHALKEDTQIMRIINYRSIEITGKMPKEEQEFYRKMKRTYALPKSQSEIDKINAINEALREGRDVSALL